MVVALAFVVAILLAPFATLVLLIAVVARRMNPDGEGDASKAWLFVVMGAGMVLNAIVLPIFLVWNWVIGKPSPPSPQHGSHR